jgi:hypothetical protein
MRGALSCHAGRHRRRRTLRAAPTLLAATVAVGLDVLAPGLFGPGLFGPQRAAAVVLPSAACFGAAAMDDGNGCRPVTAAGPTVPSVADAPADRSPSYRLPCQTRYPYTDRLSCTFGDPVGTRDVALVGNSHAVHWIPALHEIGLLHGLRITTFVSAACAVTPTPIAISASRNCTSWGNWVRDTVADGDFDLVVQSDRVFRSPVERGDPLEIYERGFREHLDRWAEAGQTVLVIRGTPKPLGDIPTCLQRNRDDYRACAAPRDRYLLPDPLAQAAYSYPSERIRVADLTDRFCGKRLCPAVIGRAIVYFDASHITATYARTAAPYLANHVRAALGGDRVREQPGRAAS